jgi:hypothetical protein
VEIDNNTKGKGIHNLKQAAKDRQKRGSRVRGIPDKADLEALRASKKQRREERKLEIIHARQEKVYNAELTRLELTTARESMLAHQRDTERCIDILPQMWKRGARPNVLNRVKDEMSTIWPITAKTEFADREVTELFKIRFTPLNLSRGVDRAQYHALQMTTKLGEEAVTRIKKTLLLERLNPKWMVERFDPKFLRMVRTTSSRAGFYMKWIYVPVGDARQDESHHPTYSRSFQFTTLRRITIPVFQKCGISFVSPEQETDCFCRIFYCHEVHVHTG